MGGYLGDFMNRIISIVALCATVSACATNPRDIAPSYVSTNGYSNMSCPQLRDEAEVVSARAAQATGAQEKNASNDAAMTGVGIILFWPALFFMKGDGAQAAEVSRLKGEMAAIQTVNRQKNCGIQFAATPA
jgi:hypothetical protein